MFTPLRIFLLLTSSCFLTNALYANTQSNAQAQQKTLVSINLCADQYLLLFPHNQPVYYSPLAADIDYNYLASNVKKSQTIQPQLDRILLKHPEKVFASPYSDTYLLHGLKNAGIETVVIPNASNFEGIKNNIALIASAIHEEAKGQQIIDALDEQLEEIQSRVRNRPHESALFYAPNGFTHGGGTIYQAILNQAGLTNLAAKLGIEGHGYLSLEKLLWYQPHYLIIEDNLDSNHSEAQALLSHPALSNQHFNATLIFVQGNLLSCPGFGSLLALEQIVNQL